MSKRLKIFVKYFLIVIFIGYYLNITSFYHSHVINGKEITHSHFYKNVNRSDGNPVDHTHSQHELFTIHVISQFLTVAIIISFFLKATNFILSQLHVPITEFFNGLLLQYRYPLRGPPNL